MLSLREQQARFAAVLFNSASGCPDPGIRADGISPAMRLGFYRTNVFENYRKALAATYPAVEKLVGSGFFRALAEQYTRCYPSHSGDVGRHGDQFAEFLRGHACARELPYLSDVARLEWSIDQSFNEADHLPLAVARLASVANGQHERLRLLLAPSCRLMSSLYPVHRIWEMCQSDFDSAGKVDLGEGRAELLIRREAFRVVVEAVKAGEFAMLMALSVGEEFADAYDLARSVDEGFDPCAFLQKQVLSGVLVDFALPADVWA